MTPEGAYRVLQMLDRVNPYRKDRKAAWWAEEAKAFADLLPDAPDTWVEGWVRNALRTGPEELPAKLEVVAAWRAEVAERLDPAALDLPYAPAEVEADDGRAIRWERAYRHAVLGGADRAVAFAAANTAVGVSPKLRPAPSVRHGGAAHVRELVAALTAARAVTSDGSVR